MLDSAKPQSLGGDPSARATDPERLVALERELEATRLELNDAVRKIETAGQERRAIEEELTARNNRLEEALAHHMATSADLRNILRGADAVLLLLDADLNIRFFTPSTKQLFNIIPGDIGRPLADLNALALGAGLLEDARTALRGVAPVEREVQAPGGAWYNRRILHYRRQDDHVDGVVIAFTDITKAKQTADALETAKRHAQAANIGRSRFLAAVSHDLRQPLQTLTLLQGLLGKIVKGEKAQNLVARLDDTLGAISEILNALFDIDRIEAGTMRADSVAFPVNDVIDRLRGEVAAHAQAKGLSLRFVSCGLWIVSDPRLLEQMIRNLLSKALEYTRHGKVLVGCRRRAGRLSIEIWNTGGGIQDRDIALIFDEYHQLDNEAGETGRGVGLGLSIVQRLGFFLEHWVHVRSNPGKGSLFAVEVPLAPSGGLPSVAKPGEVTAGDNHEDEHRAGEILVIEDDVEVCELLELFLKDEGHRAATARDGVSALELVGAGGFRPDIILCDYNLPGGMDGLRLSLKLREKLHRKVPVIILAATMSTGAIRKISLHDCLLMNKPVKAMQLRDIIQSLLPPSQIKSSTKPIGVVSRGGDQVIFVVDDDALVREAMGDVLRQEGWTVEAFDSSEAFLDAYRPGRNACLLIDAYLPGMSGLELLEQLLDDGDWIPAIMITGKSDVATAVLAMKAGAADFIEKPIGGAQLLASITRAFEQPRDSSKAFALREHAAKHVAQLTPRQREILALVLAGQSSKNIAAELALSQRTVESHRASIMKKTGSKSLPALARLALSGLPD
jgi:two-component system CheB/CheR fusion protein